MHLKKYLLRKSFYHLRLPKLNGNEKGDIDPDPDQARPLPINTKYEKFRKFSICCGIIKLSYIYFQYINLSSVETCGSNYEYEVMCISVNLTCNFNNYFFEFNRVAVISEQKMDSTTAYPLNIHSQN